MIKKKIIASIIGISMLLSLCACGSEEEVAAPVQEETEESVVEETEVEEPEIDETLEEEETEEEAGPEEILSYVEEHGLEFCDDSFVKVTGLAMDAFNHADYIKTDVDYEWEIVSIEDAEEEGFKTVTVLQEAKGYRWFDGKVKKTDVTFPSAFVVDVYTGMIVPNEAMHYDETTEEHSADVEWNGETYHISYIEDVKWDLENEWKPLTGDTFAGWCTSYDTLTITIPENYDGLALLLPPVLSTKEFTEVDEHILDYWADKDCYLFKINMNAETETEESNISEASDSDESDTAKAVETKAEASKQAHSHSYVETVTANPTCSNPGTKTFTCACGDSYTESIPATGEHQWVENTEIVHHDEIGHNESTPIEVNTFHCRGCAGSWTDLDEFRYHSCDGSASASTGFYYTTETTYDNTWVVDQEAWDEPITTSTCSACGATR